MIFPSTALNRYRNAPPDAVERRLDELSREWDIERAIEANAAAIALQGWCPPVPVLRRLGFRTSREIFEERLAVLAATRRRPQGL